MTAYANDTDRLRLRWPDATADDLARLQAASRRVLDRLADGRWYTPEQLQAVTGQSGSATTARLRDLRNAGYIIDRERRGTGYAYRLAGRVSPLSTPRYETEHACDHCQHRRLVEQQARMHMEGER